jgi:hypothetical protein
MRFLVLFLYRTKIKIDRIFTFKTQDYGSKKSKITTNVFILAGAKILKFLFFIFLMSNSHGS